ncbi:unnamed protein product [Owenia fusiformis]|uniref:Nitric oxide synthase n=1 Tax=Owenia fusiformis TaxID=6347 RepID=A0A8S4Q6J3_OWEFU|nr:unnamed protein product [Owenia fusiformis]
MHSSVAHPQIQKKYIRVRNVQDASLGFNDTLHKKAAKPTLCTRERCMGSTMMTVKQSGTPRAKEDVLTQAKDFLEQFYISMKRSGTPAHQKRLDEVVESIEKRGTYDLTSSELTFGAKTAWRNAPRCIGRIQWSKLQVFDARHINTARGMFEAICNHIKYGTNKGNIRSAITIFPQRTDGKHDFKVWNPQFIQYAGYKQPNGGVIGDSANVAITEVCIKLGWKPGNGMFDVLPLVLSANGQDPEMFDIPKDLVFEVQFEHPRFDWFESLGLKWFALPAVSNMLFDCGGLEFPAAPFNGWYMGTEIGARDLADPARYNILERVAVLMGLDTKKSSSLWKDSALVEVNIAVLHSFQKSNTTITDHHAASDSFMKHMENEVKARGGCPSDWVWVVPPMSSSMTPVFHQEMVNYNLKPSYEYQELAWKTHEWKKDKERGKAVGARKKRKIGFKELARAVKFSSKLMGKALARRISCTILYATETGKSESYAKTLCDIFMHAFDAKVLSMDDYDTAELEHEALVLVITSTFGNGDPPENGEAFGKALYHLKEPDNKSGSASTIMRLGSDSKETRPESLTNGSDLLDRDIGPMGNLRFSVFGLGSRAYPHFCAFAHYVDNILYDLGGERIHTLVEGDELCGQEESFKIWAHAVFKSACETFCVGDDVNISAVTGALADNDTSWKEGKYRLTPTAAGKPLSLDKGLSKLHKKSVFPCKLVSCENLQSKDSGRRTLLVKMNTQVAGSDELGYQPGDHVGIFAANRDEYVNFIITRLQNAPPPDELIQLEIRKSSGNTNKWAAIDRFPPMTLRTALTNYLDITTPPTPVLLQHFATQTSDAKDKLALEKLATDTASYENWKSWKLPNLVEVLKEFPSVKVNPTLLLAQLPLLQQRFYSISSSTLAHPDEVHITVIVVEYRAQGGKGPLHQGVCSAWFEKLKEGDSIPCYIRTAPNFHIPENASLPIVMVGPGTGIAPFRSFWQQRKIEVEMGELNKQGKFGFGEIDLYFGCRNSKMDDIYRHETMPLQADGYLSHVYTAFSREPGQSKEYVQTVLSKNSKNVYRQIVVEHGHFYVCGDVSMASEVSNALRHIIKTEGKMTSDEAQQFILTMRENNRFHEDIFGVSLKVQSDRKLQLQESFDFSAQIPER